MKQFLTIFAITALVIVLTGSYNTKAQTPSDTSRLSVSGLLDVNFNKNCNNPSDHINGYRNFDSRENQFNLNLLKLTLQKSGSVGFRADIGFGQTMEFINAAGTSGLGSQLSLKNIEQAYITTTLPVGDGLSVNIGKMSTHMGGEVIETSSNINYSRSLLFTLAIPYDHFGVCAAYPLTSYLNASVYLLNGWNNADENNTDKTAGAQLIYTPSSSLTVTGNWIGGAEETQSTKKRNVFDGIINWQISDALLVNLNGDYGMENLSSGGTAIWKGIAATGKYNISNKSSFALRGEYYYDQSGFTTGVIQELKETTLTYEFRPAANIITRIEFRRDWSDMNAFRDADGNQSKNNQNTLLLGIVYSF
jgi:hypothetical protein